MKLHISALKNWKKLCLLLVLFIQMPVTVTAQVQNQTLPTIESPTALLFNANSGQIIFEKESDIPMDAGSVSKLLSLYILRKAIDAGEIDWDTTVPISDYAYAVSQDYDVANVPLRQDKTYTVEELYEAVIINLAHGATIALSELLAGSEPEFVQAMSQQLDAWGIEDYDLINATGLTSAYDPTVVGSEEEGTTNQLTAEAVGVIAYYLLEDYPDILSLTSVTEKTFRQGTSDAFQMTNYNQMLPSSNFGYPDVDGLSSGSSLAGGYNLVVTADRDNYRLLAVILGATSNEERYNSATALLDYGFGYFRNDRLIQANQVATQISEIPVVGATEKSVSLVYEEPLDLTVPIGQNNVSLAYDFIPNDAYFDDNNRLVSPVAANTTVGSVQVTLRDSPINYLPNVQGNQTPVKIASAIEEAPWYTNSWNQLSDGFSQTMESIRVFFTDLFN